MSKYVNNSAIPGQNEYTIKILTDTDKSHTIKILIDTDKLPFRMFSFILPQPKNNKKNPTYFSVSIVGLHIVYFYIFSQTGWNSNYLFYISLHHNIEHVFTCLLVLWAFLWVSCFLVVPLFNILLSFFKIELMIVSVCYLCCEHFLPIFHFFLNFIYSGVLKYSIMMC